MPKCTLLLRRLLKRHTVGVVALLMLVVLAGMGAEATAGSPGSGAAPGIVLTSARAPLSLPVRLIHEYFPRDAWVEATKIAQCESTFHTTAVHYDSNGTRDLGLFQLNTGGTEQELLSLTGKSVNDLNLAFSPAWNVQAAALLYHRDGWSRWSCA
jgi:hypothetical protein